MILHTIIPEQCVLFPEQIEEHFFSIGNTYLGVRGDGVQETLCRVVSTNPRDYLNPRYAIGTVYNPLKQKKTFEECTSFRV